MIMSRLIRLQLTLGLMLGSLACSADSDPSGRSGAGATSGSGGAGNGGAGAYNNPDVNNPVPMGGASGMGLAGSSGDPSGVCEVIRANADPQIPDMMIVLDRSGSMTEGGRWRPSVSAIKSVIQQL